MPPVEGAARHSPFAPEIRCEDARQQPEDVVSLLLLGFGDNTGEEEQDESDVASVLVGTLILAVLGTLR